MIKLDNTTATALTAGQVIPLTQVFNSNTDMVFNGTTNEIAIKNPGFFEITGMFTITATATGVVTISLYNNGVAIPEATTQYSFASIGSTKTLILEDIERIIATINPVDLTKLTFVVSTACTMNSANVSVKRIK